MTKIILLSQDKQTIVDDEDYDELNKHKWYYNNGYAVRHSKNKFLYMHRVIMNTPENMETDHVDNNKLNNLKSNLRNCTHIENGKNVNKHSNNKSGHKGVFWYKAGNKWQSQIMVSGENIHLGYFDDINDGVIAYDLAAIRYFGEFAKLNFDISNYK